LNDFDQPVYLTIAYDLDRYGVFSNGVFDETDSAIEAPRPGIIFAPLYPTIIFLAMKLDVRFADAVRCTVESSRGHREAATCEVYAAPALFINALFLTLGVIAIALASEAMFPGKTVLLISCLFAAAALMAEAELFSFAMTESTSFALYSALALMMVRAYTTDGVGTLIVAGVLLSLLCLTRAEYLALLPVLLLLLLVCNRRPRLPAGAAWTRPLIFFLAFLILFVPWLGRNALSAGKFAVTEEYGSASLIERFAFDDMTAQEFFLAFPYCVAPFVADVGDAYFSEAAMKRFHYDQEESFFAVGRARRNMLMAAYVKLDSIIADVVRDELRQNWWRYLLTIIPLSWCGMWVGSPVCLILIPLFVLGCRRAWRTSQSLPFFYSLPAFLMLGLHAAIANHYTRYNLILVGPFSVMAALACLNLPPLPSARSAPPIA
jgi:hypothetical protein